MSIESLLFIAFFFLLPLIERLLERNRRRRQPIPPPDDDVARPPMPQEAPQRPRRTAETPEPMRPQPAPIPAPIPAPRPVPPPPPIPRETRRRDPARRPPADRPGPHDLPAPQQRRPPAPVPAPRPMPPPLTVSSEDVLRAVRARERQQTQTRPASAPAVSSKRDANRRTQKALTRILRNPRSLRRAILVSAVLGPCKALEPDSR